MDRTVNGLGRVIASSQLQTVSNLEGGIVEEIFVTVGQQVAAGTALMQLDQTQSGAELGSGSATIAALQAKVERLSAEVQGRAPTFPASGPASIEAALYQARQAELAALTNAGQSRISAAQRAVSEAQSNLAAHQSAASGARQELDMIRPLVERGIEPRLSLVQAQSRAATTQSEAAAAAASIARASANVSQAMAESRQQMSDWKNRAGAELTAAQAELTARLSALPALKDKEARKLVTAPVAGKINRILITTKGGSVPPGAPLVEIVPSDDALVVEAMVSPKDIANVYHEQSAKISLTAYDSSIYGSLQGDVFFISPDAIVNEKTGESYYLVRIRTAKAGLKDHEGRQLKIGPGMVANVSLLGEKQTVLSYILSPFSRLRERAFRE